MDVQDYSEQCFAVMNTTKELRDLFSAEDAVITFLEIYDSKGLFEHSTSIVLRDDIARLRRCRAALLRVTGELSQ